uniref:MSHA biogenesis protein MshK n=1 Tax=Solibacter usitatus (strain Ellin6076) TaxID=234267 RepID=Q028H8_SOLUE
MRLLLLLALLAAPANAKKELKWVPALVESSSRQLYNGGSSPGTFAEATLQSVRESIYLDAGAWLYHVTQIVTTAGTLRLRDGARVEVAEDGKQLIIRVDGKQHKLHIEEKSRGKSPAK